MIVHCVLHLCNTVCGPLNNKEQVVHVSYRIVRCAAAALQIMIRMYIIDMMKANCATEYVS